MKKITKSEATQYVASLSTDNLIELAAKLLEIKKVDATKSDLIKARLIRSELAVRLVHSVN